MKTTILAAAAATVLGLAGGTAWTVVTHEPPPMQADSMVAGPGGEHPADSTAAAEHAGPAADSAGHGETRPAAHADSAAFDPSGGAVALDPRPRAAPAERANGQTGAPAPTAAAEPEPEDGADQLARIFTAMQPRDAARVLAQLTDPEVREILTRMGARQAASVLSNMSPERAAILSRTVLAGDEGGA